MLPQDPVTPATAPTHEIVQQLQALGWVDHTALAVLLVFFVLGLFKGLIWQVSRIAILVVAYVVAGRFGHDVAALLGSAPPAPSAPAAAADPNASGVDAAQLGDTTLYLAYVLLFVVVLVLLSLLAMLIKKLADKAGLSFFDRLGGGVLGVATGACVVVAMLFLVNMFLPQSPVAEAARSSHSLHYSQKAIDLLGSAVDDDLRSLLQLQPLRGPEPLPGAPDEPPGSPSGDGGGPQQPPENHPTQPGPGAPSQPRPMRPGELPLPAPAQPGGGGNR
ncbi:MAG: CvpA family protein [Planctomycetes bacterium]|nr:CvpA family protein [Planctomycetota bacterium]